MKQSAARKLMDRFKPGIFDRLKQSKEAKSGKALTVVKADPTPAQEHNQPTTAPLRGNSLITVNSMFHGTTSAVTTNFATNSVTLWYDWNRTYTTAATWNTWNTNVHVDCGTGGDTWLRWHTIDGQEGFVRTNNGRILEEDVRHANAWRAQVEESEEAKKARADREAKWRAEEEVRKQRYAAELKAVEDAKVKARQLLYSCLTQEQRHCLETNRYFFVQAKSGRRYRIDEGTHGNVKVVDRDGKIIERLCIQPNGVPVGDSMLAQKLLIETAEDAFRRHANITLANGQVLMGDAALLDGDMLAQVIPFRKAA